jgi:S1-C subfamily serine protease
LIDGENGVVVGDVLENSIANQSGFQANDVIVEAAGRPVAKSGEFIAIIQDQTPGYWLPVTIKRNDEITELVAEIPPRR